MQPEAEEHEFDAPALGPVATVVQREHTYRRLLAYADGAAALLAACLVALAAGHTPELSIALVPLGAILVAKISGLYDRDDQVILKSNIAEWRTVLQSATITSIGVYLSWRAVTTASRGDGMRVFLLLVIGSFVLTTGLRVLARRSARRITPDERCVIVGEPRSIYPLAERLDQAPGVELVGAIAEDSLTGSVVELRRITEELSIHRLVIAPSSNASQASTLHLIQAAKFIGIRVSLQPSVMTAVGGFAVFEELDGLTLLGVPRFGLSRSSMTLKRAFDLVVGGVALLTLAPLMALIAIAIKLDSRGPVLFFQVRIGRGGMPFRILKFRSMVDGADALKAGLRDQNEAAGLFKIAADPRITRVGRTIRATHLDELPQLFNVLRGEMSLVGPRPLVLEEDVLFTGRDRHRVHLTPGMTGPWQLKGPMNTPITEMAMLDYRYASNWSIWTDLDILLRTALRVANGGGH